MKQNLLIILIALCCGGCLLVPGTSMAQSHGPSFARTTAARGSILTSSKRKLDQTLLKYVTDSVRYTYSGGRNGDLTTAGGVPFDSSIAYTYITKPSSGMQGGATVKHYNSVGLVDTESVYWSNRTIRLFNAAGKPTQCDYQGSTGTSWRPFQREFRYYNGTGKDSVYIMTAWNATTSTWDNDRRTSWTYNSSGAIASLLYEQWNGSSAWVGLFRVFNTYNTAGLLASDTMEAWSTSSSAWDVVQRRRNTYAGSFMTLQVTEQVSGGTVSYTDSVLFSSSGSPATTVLVKYQKGSAMPAFQPNQRITLTTTAAGNPAVQINEGWQSGAWLNTQRVTFTYNSDDQLTHQYAEKWDGSKWAFDPYTSYDIRHTYGSPVGIAGNPASSAGNGIRLSLSPVPASANISLKLSLSSPLGFEAGITDLNGKQLRTWSGIATSSEYVEQVDIRDLVSGVYYLSISSREGHVARAFIVR